MLVIIWSFKQWYHYLKDTLNIEVWSDHKNLKHFMVQITLNDYQTHWLIQLALYDFTIHYWKSKLNSADDSFCHPDYMNQEFPDIIVLKLMPILSNKLRLAQSNSLEEAVLATVLLETDEQISVESLDSLTSDLIQALFLQVITWSAVRWTIYKFCSLDLSRENAILHKSTALDSSSDMKKKIALYKSSTLNSSDSFTALLLFAAQKRIALHEKKSVL